MNIQFTNSEKKEAIFKSTLHLIHEQGFHGSPMSKIAENAQVAIGSIYHYFDSKEALIIELFNYCRIKAHQAMFENDHAEIPYRKRFFTIWNNLVQYYIANPAVLSFFDQFYASPFSKIAFTNEKFCLQGEVALFLESGIQMQIIKKLDINILSAAFVGTVIATAKRYNYGHYKFDDTQMNEMAGIIWDGIKLGYAHN
jgi:AcrR family transcriptional regulator